MVEDEEGRGLGCAQDRPGINSTRRTGDGDQGQGPGHSVDIVDIYVRGIYLSERNAYIIIGIPT